MEFQNFLKKLQTQINELSETAEEKGVNCSDIDPEVLNFLDYEERSVIHNIEFEITHLSKRR